MSEAVLDQAGVLLRLDHEAGGNVAKVSEGHSFKSGGSHCLRPDPGPEVACPQRPTAGRDEHELVRLWASAAGKVGAEHVHQELRHRQGPCTSAALGVLTLEEMTVNF